MSRNYIIEDGKLTWADPNIYLKNTGTSYIDTGFIPTKNTSVITHFKIDSIRGVDGSARNVLLGASSVYQQMKNFYAIIWQGSETYAVYWGNTTNTSAGSYIQNKVWSTNEKYELRLGRNFSMAANNAVYDSSGEIFTQGYRTDSTEDIDMEGLTLCLFQRARSLNNSATYFLGNLYTVEVYEEQELVRNLVPVPQGLQIGNFTVPSNGMFDIVNQQFHGNQGTGQFTYGWDI